MDFQNQDNNKIIMILLAICPSVGCFSQRNTVTEIEYLINHKNHRRTKPTGLNTFTAAQVMLNPTAGDIVSETNTKKINTLIDPAVPFSVRPGKLAQGHTHKKKEN